jgi:hypothetical protein
MHSKSSGPTQQLALCLGSRHANGHVRETCLRQLLAHDCDWVLPLWSGAAGEYVLEIAEHLTEHIPWSPRSYGALLPRTPSLITLRKQQAASYWDCYHRQRYPLLRQHPGIRFLRWVEAGKRTPIELLERAVHADSGCALPVGARSCAFGNRRPKVLKVAPTFAQRHMVGAGVLSGQFHIPATVFPEADAADAVLATIISEK